MLYFTALFVGLVLTAGCRKSASLKLEAAAQQQEQLRLQEQKERAALVEQLKAAALAQEKKREPIKNLQKQIDALDEQISQAWSKGKDFKALENAQDALEAKKYELERQ